MGGLGLSFRQCPALFFLTPPLILEKCPDFPCSFPDTQAFIGKHLSYSFNETNKHFLVSLYCALGAGLSAGSVAANSPWPTEPDESNRIGGDLGGRTKLREGQAGAGRAEQEGKNAPSLESRDNRAGVSR